MKYCITLLFALLCMPARAQTTQADSPFICSANTSVRLMTKACGAQWPALTGRAEAAYASWYRRNKLASTARAELCDTHMQKAARSPVELEQARQRMNAKITAVHSQLVSRAAKHPESLCIQTLEQVEQADGPYELSKTE